MNGKRTNMDTVTKIHLFMFNRTSMEISQVDNLVVPGYQSPSKIEITDEELYRKLEKLKACPDYSTNQQTLEPKLQVSVVPNTTPTCNIQAVVPHVGDAVSQKALPIPRATSPTAPKRKTPNHTMVAEVWQKLYPDSFEATCIMCQESKMRFSDRKTWEVAHIIPHSKGGPATIDNLAPLCFTCNRQMSNTNFNDYIRTWHEDRYKILLERFGIRT